jgi:hypothetical protein
MAVIEGFLGLEVTIHTNGRITKEYDDTSRTDEVYRHPWMVTKYIECKNMQRERHRERGVGARY